MGGPHSPSFGKCGKRPRRSPLPPHPSVKRAGAFPRHTKPAASLHPAALGRHRSHAPQQSVFQPLPRDPALGQEAGKLHALAQPLGHRRQHCRVFAGTVSFTSRSRSSKTAISSNSTPSPSSSSWLATCKASPMSHSSSSSSGAGPASPKPLSLPPAPCPPPPGCGRTAAARRA